MAPLTPSKSGPWLAVPPIDSSYGFATWALADEPSTSRAPSDRAANASPFRNIEPPSRGLRPPAFGPSWTPVPEWTGARRRRVGHACAGPLRELARAKFSGRLSGGDPSWVGKGEG